MVYVYINGEILIKEYTFAEISDIKFFINDRNEYYNGC